MVHPDIVIIFIVFLTIIVLQAAILLIPLSLYIFRYSSWGERMALKEEALNCALGMGYCWTYLMSSHATIRKEW